MAYNLLEESWIPVLYRDGRRDHVSTCKALEDASEIRQVAASNPMDRVAVVRFLLAVLYWCKGNPQVDMVASSNAPFPAVWFSKLDQNKDCFDLLGHGRRFYQHRKEGDRLLSAAYLVQEVPTGTNWWHFRHATQGLHGLCPACCALGLLRLPLFATSGGRGKPPGVNGRPPVYALPVADSLAGTLRLSWQWVRKIGTPAWEKPDLNLPDAGEVPLLTGLTWLPRRVWLSDPQPQKADCISCGRRESTILRSVFGSIGSTRTDPDGPGRVWADPHVLYSVDTKGQVTALRPGNALGAGDAAAGQWTRTIAGILKARGQGETARVWVVSFSTVRNDKYVEATERFVEVPDSREEAEASLERVERWHKESSGLAGRLKRQVEQGTSRKHVEIPAAIVTVRPHVESKVSSNVGELLAGGDEAWGEAAREYSTMMDIIARSLSPGFTASAIERRQAIASVVPNMGPRTKPTKKRGGDK
ncbi:MAG: type I-E CRISPR-associated protein Cse1/CasA [Planctomycetota bacterium]